MLFQNLAYILQTIFDTLMNQLNKMGLHNTVNSNILLLHHFFYIWAVLNQLHINYKFQYYFYKTDISYSLNVSYASYFETCIIILLCSFEGNKVHSNGE